TFRTTAISRRLWYPLLPDSYSIKGSSDVAPELNCRSQHFQRGFYMKMQNTRQLYVLTALVVVGSIGASACASLNKKEEGAAIGAAAGGAVGGVIGNQTGSTARGAIIGAVVGGTAGAIIGHQMDQQAKE